MHDSLFAQADADHNGTLSAEEYQKLIELRQARQARMAAATPDFASLDNNHDGQLDRNELRAGMRAMHDKMKASGAKAYLVNTGWNGTGKRISIKDTRGIIDAILSGAINEAPTKKIPYFDFEVPTALPGVDPAILDPRDTYADAAQWEEKAKDLAGRFVKNFAKYEGNEHGKALVSAGPQL